MKSVVIATASTTVARAIVTSPGKCAGGIHARGPEFQLVVIFEIDLAKPGLGLSATTIELGPSGQENRRRPPLVPRAKTAYPSIGSSTA